MTDLTQQILEDFVFVDCRLGNHPKVRAGVLWLKDELLLPAAGTRGFSSGTYSLNLGSHGESVTKRVFERRSYTVRSGFGFSEELRSELAVPLFESSELDFFKESHLGLAQCLAALIAYVKLHIEPRSARPW